MTRDEALSTVGDVLKLVAVPVLEEIGKLVLSELTGRATALQEASVAVEAADAAADAALKARFGGV